MSRKSLRALQRVIELFLGINNNIGESFFNFMQKLMEDGDKNDSTQ